MWLRYLRTRPVVLLSITAVGLAVALLIVVSSLFNGFIRAFQTSATELIGDISLSSPRRFGHADRLIGLLADCDLVQDAAGTIQVPGLLHLSGGDVRPVQVWGIDPQQLARVTKLRQWLLIGQLDQDHISDAQHDQPGGAYVGIGLLMSPDPNTDRYDIEHAINLIGKRIVLSYILPSQQQGQQRPARKVLELQVADIIHTGNAIFDQQSVFLPITELVTGPDPNTILVDRIQIKLRPGTDRDRAISLIAGIWQGFAKEVLGWDPYQIYQVEILPAAQLQARFMGEVRKQLGVLMLIFGVVDTAAIVLVFCIFYMIVRLKIKDIAILKACGCPSTQIWWLFLDFGLVVGIIGSGLGVILGYLFTDNINSIEDWLSRLLGLRLWDSSVYLFEQIPNDVSWKAVLIITLLATAAAAIGALTPAIMAARTRPVEILRYE